MGEVRDHEDITGRPVKNAAGRAKRRRNEKKPRLECGGGKKGGQDVWKMKEMRGGLEKMADGERIINSH